MKDCAPCPVGTQIGSLESASQWFKDVLCPVVNHLLHIDRRTLTSMQKKKVGVAIFRHPSISGCAMNGPIEIISSFVKTLLFWGKSAGLRYWIAGR